MAAENADSTVSSFLRVQFIIRDWTLSLQISLAGDEGGNMPALQRNSPVALRSRPGLF